MRRSRSGVLPSLLRRGLDRLDRRTGRVGRRLPFPARWRASYAPERDGLPDPGEVCWAWVPYEDDPSQGKDRPVLIIARREAGAGAERLLALMLTSKDHDRDAADEARWGRYWMDVGSGGWDRERRPSEVRLDRLIELTATGVRREGTALDKGMFERVIAEARRFHDL
ncbi:type II toxin-antitoxin system PemK/MazF family toxin [Nocardioides sp. KR10-350]|uniref:type II toxin-antitoxin system PemK/MazF family toxin n=1 Tax=Nocardioides cheoyonin TaxID=3156615 RepID=UPI0032B42253